MEPINVTREEFPMSDVSVEGMIKLVPKLDNYEIYYDKNITYIQRGEKELHLEILKPVNAEKKTPLVIYIPGSAFHRQDVVGRVPQLVMLAMRGICVALLEYRGSEDAVFPALVLDSKAGVRYMVEHAEEYNIDKNRIFIMGDSSGAYTSLMTGITWGKTSLEEYSDDMDNPIKGIIDFYGPTNITTMNDEPSSQDHRTPDSPEGCLIGRKHVLDNPDLSKPTIIANYVNNNKYIPKIIMFHGSNDELVPFGQSAQLYKALKEIGGNVKLYQLVGAHHGDRQFWSKEVLDMVEEFIVK